MECAFYIRGHAKETLSVSKLAEQSGYSAYHFSRIFREMMGTTLMDYVKQQRLLGAAREIAKGRKILDAAVDYGYETHSGFTRAFHSQFGYSPALLRAYYVREALEKGEWKNMGLYLKETDQHAKPEELFEELCVMIHDRKLECGKMHLEDCYGLAKKIYEGRSRYSGDAYVTHPLNVAIILADMEADEDTICAGLLHDIWEMEQIPEDFWENSAITPAMKAILEEYRHFDAYCSCDERVVLIALADRLHNMRTIEFVDSVTWKERAKKTMELFGPIAAECGKVKCRMEFDELSERYLSQGIGS